MGILLLSGVVAAVTHLGEIKHFAQLARQAQPIWSLAAFLLQIGTYVCAATVWHQTLRCGDIRYPLFSLIPLGLAKLFSDQALPSGGVSGTCFFVEVLKRRGVPTDLCMAIMLVSLVAYYTAYLVSALTSVALLWFYHAIHIWIIVLVGLFCLVAVAIPTGALWLRHWGKKSLPKLLMRSPGIRDLLEGFTHAPGYLLSNPFLVTKAALLYVSIFLPDAATFLACS